MEAIPQVKHPQFILGMEATFFDSHHFSQELNPLSAEDFLSWPETQAALVIAQRNRLETDTRFRHLIPYVVPRQLGKDSKLRLFVYQRTKKVGESRLAGKFSIGIGGHVDLDDVCAEASIIDLCQTLFRATRREVQEELVYDMPGDVRRHDRAVTHIPTYADLFITGHEGVDKVHLGIVLHLDIGTEHNIKCKEEELVTVGWRTPQEAAELDLESWSRLIVKELI